VASFETEFYAWDAEGPLDRMPYAGSYALTPAAEFVAELAGTLRGRGSGRGDGRHRPRPRPRRADDGRPRHPGRRGARLERHQAASRLPDEALDALEDDRVVKEALGEPLARTHIAVERAQAAIARELPPEDVAATAAMLY